MVENAGAVLETFRLEARAVLTETAATTGWSVEEFSDAEEESARGARLRRFDAELHRRGWSGLAFPKGVGGQGLTLMHQIVFLEEASVLGVPTPYNRVALGIVAPALEIFGTPEQKQRFLPPLLAGEEIWCQGFSEPEAGSDLASLRTRATRLPDGTWRVEGQKIWTTLGSVADYCFLLARTGPPQSRHRGITAFIVPMSAPGITVRPIVQINGDTDFTETFFDGVLISQDAALGEVDKGWSVAMTALSYERTAHLLQRQLRLEQMLTEFTAKMAEADRARLLELRIDSLAMKYSVKEQIRALSEGTDVDTSGNATKVLWSQTYQALCRLAVEVTADGVEQDQLAAWTREYYTSLATTIYAGTNEIPRNIIAERRLGLPRS